MSDVTNKYLKANLDSYGKNMDDVIQKVLDKASSYRCQRAKVGASTGMRKSLCIENKEFTLANSIESQSFGIVVHKDQKRGTSSVNSINEKDLDQALKDAADLASFSVADDALTMPAKDIAPKAKELDFLYDDKIAKMGLDDLKDLLCPLVEVFKKEPKFALDRLEMSITCGRSSIMNNLGMYQSEAQTTINWDYLGMARDGENVSGMDYDSNFCYDLANFGQTAEEDIQTFIERVLKNLNPIKTPSYKGKVILSPRAVSSLIVSPLLYHMSGSNIMDNKSKFADKIGESVSSQMLNISDDPHNKQFAGATSFDSDGLPTMKMNLIENGVLKTHLLSCYTANKLSKKPTHTAGGPFCLNVSAGSNTLSELTSSQDEILFVDRFSGNTDPLTGNFSGVAKTSRLFKNGKDLGPVKETMIAGNMLDLCNQIVGGTKEQTLISGRFLSSTLLVDGVSVSGA